MTTREIIRLEVTESTSSTALEFGERGAAPGTLVVARAQTLGRGRLSRFWLSRPGMGLYFSLILRPQLEPEDLSKITLTAGLAVVKVVEELYRIEPKIKWPNDLLLNGKKFGGILTETGSVLHLAEGQNPLVVVGVGLNLFPPLGGFPADLQKRATALSHHVDGEIDAEALLQACVAAIEIEVRRLEGGEFAAILAEWRKRDAVYGKTLSWITRQGQAVTGVALGPDAEGLLRIRDGEGKVYTVLSGDLNLVAKFSGKTK
jgi:BirA family biotin operon repressor/biotin-[acetyl-CoA-carboxylase] ligase